MTPDEQARWRDNLARTRAARAHFAEVMASSEYVIAGARQALARTRQRREIVPHTRRPQQAEGGGVCVHS